MADATAVTVQALTANGTKALTADVNSAATGAQVLAADVGSQSDRVVLAVTNGGTNQISITIGAGTNPPAFRAGLSTLSKTGITNGAVVYFGPFETARFIGTDGKLSVTVAPTTATNALASCSWVCFKLPMV